MDFDNPPSYTEATRKGDAPTIFARYVDPADIPNCTLVNKAWDSAFTPVLWADPFNPHVLGREMRISRICAFLRIVLVDREARESSVRCVRTLDLTGIEDGDVELAMQGRPQLMEKLFTMPNVQNLIL